ncbi:subtilase, partial [Obelidium mucronatum]
SPRTTADSLHHLHARAGAVAEQVDMHYIGQIGELKGYYQSLADLSDPETVQQELNEHPSVGWSELMVPRVLSRRSPPSHQDIAKTFAIEDPEFKYQWHLINDIEGQKGNDHNVSAAWSQGIFGKGSTVCLVDDGLYHNSTDLKDNYFAEGSYDFNDHLADAGPKETLDRHGTRCAGEIAAVKNSVCGVGMAYQAKVSAVRILGNNAVSQADEAAAINYKMQDNHIYSCSWGPTDDGRTLEAPSTLVAEAFGLGSIFVFASGNGGLSQDNCNFDGFTNSIYTITVSSVDRNNEHPGYSEWCSANMIVMYSSSDVRHDDAIATTDWYLGVKGDVCTRSHGGTSAAAPLASGMYALVHSIRPDLNWRDFQHLSVRTAVPIDLQHASWFKNAAGRMYSHAYGYGKLDAYHILELAKTWKSVPKQVKLSTDIKSPESGSGSPIPQETGTDVRIAFPITTEMLSKANFGILEHVTVTVNIEHAYRGDVNVDLISPAGIVSQLAVKRSYDGDSSGFQNWTFMSVVHWDENPKGTWQVVVSDHDNLEKKGVFKDAMITFYGSFGGKIDDDGSKQVVKTVLPMTATGIVGGVVESGVSKVSPVPPAPSSNEDGGKVSVIGWVFGGLGLIGAFGALVWCLTRKRQRTRREIVEVDGHVFKPLHDADEYDGDFEMEE